MCLNRLPCGFNHCIVSSEVSFGSEPANGGSIVEQASNARLSENVQSTSYEEPTRLSTSTPILFVDQNHLSFQTLRQCDGSGLPRIKVSLKIRVNIQNSIYDEP